MATLLTLPAELILHIAAYQSPPTVLSFLRANRALYHLLTDSLTDSVFNDLAYASKAIYYAAERENKHMIRRLVKAGILKDIDFTLNTAVQNESPKVISTLLDCGVPANTQDDWGETPLIVAATSNRVEIVKLLVPRADVDVNSTDHRRTTALAYAVRGTRGGVEVVRALLERADTDVNMRDIDGRSALYHAVEVGGQESVASLLARPEVNVNFVDHVEQGMTALHRAVFIGDQSIVGLLLHDSRVDVNLGDRMQHTPLHLAVKRGNEPVLRMLLDCPRVDVNAPNAVGCTPLEFAVTKSRKAITSMLVSNPRVNVNLPDPHLQTPLSIAAQKARTTALQLLLGREDLDVNFRCESGMTPLSHAAQEPLKVRIAPKRYERVISLLGADPRVDVNLIDQSLETPLHKAARARGPNLVEELLRHPDIAVNARNQDGSTPLCSAILKAGREEREGAVLIVQALLADQRVDVNTQDKKGRTPLHLAVINRQVKIAGLLLAHEKIDKHLMDGKGLKPEEHTPGAKDIFADVFGMRARSPDDGVKEGKETKVKGEREGKKGKKRKKALHWVCTFSCGWGGRGKE